MKELLNSRESELLQDLEEIYKIYVEKAALEHKEITESFEEEAQQYSKIALVLESATNPLSKIREIQNTTKKQLDFKELESLNISKLEVSLQEDYLNSLIKSNIKVCLGNPAEVMIRRTNITRALK